MKRTSLLLPAHLHTRAHLRASQLGLSLGEVVRQALTRWLEERDAEAAEDPLFDPSIVYEGDAPTDVSVRHDDYIYGEEGHDVSPEKGKRPAE